jgi:IrrE N-terminal-like domain
MGSVVQTASIALFFQAIQDVTTIQNRCPGSELRWLRSTTQRRSRGSAFHPESWPTKLVASADGQIVMHSYNGKQEEGANWLAWSLIIPREALLCAARRQLLISQVARLLGVSEVLVDYRLRITGVRALLQSTRSKDGSRDVAKPLRNN